jgi:hypothetical protein
MDSKMEAALAATSARERAEAEAQEFRRIERDLWEEAIRSREDLRDDLESLSDPSETAAALIATLVRF